MQVDFYQLTRDPAEKVLPFIAQRVLDDKGNWRSVEHDFDRVFYLFPPSHTDNARSAWRNLGESVERRYWKQDGGKWMQGP